MYSINSYYIFMLETIIESIIIITKASAHPTANPDVKVNIYIYSYKLINYVIIFIILGCSRAGQKRRLLLSILVGGIINI